MNQEDPLVSVIVPSYNHEKYITECIESIVDQTYKNIELIVIDDGSSDNTKNNLNILQAKYGFTLIFQENHGISFTLNRGLKEFSHGEYVTFCASDDYWILDKIEKQVEFMENNRFYPMCYGKTYYVNESSQIIQKSIVRNQVLRGGFLFEDILLFKIHPPVNYLFRKCIFDEVGYYNEKYFVEDYYMNLKISSKYAIGFIDDYISYYRVFNSSFKIVRFDQVSDSHLMAIEEFKNHRLYKNAKAMVYLRKCDFFSGYTDLKKKALFNLVKSISLCCNVRFWIAIAKLFIYWKY